MCEKSVQRITNETKKRKKSLVSSVLFCFSLQDSDFANKKKTEITIARKNETSESG